MIVFSFTSCHQFPKKDAKSGNQIAVEPECQYCNPNDTHTISLDMAINMIYEFNLRFKDKVDALGGAFDLDKLENKMLVSYITNKIHYGFDPKSRRMFIVLDDGECNESNGGKWRTDPSVSNKDLITPNPHDDICFYNCADKNCIREKIMAEDDKSQHEMLSIKKDQTEYYKEKFNENEKLKKFYPCDAFYFVNDKGLGELSTIYDKSKKIRYYFGYDTRDIDDAGYPITHKLRLIFFAINPDDGKSNTDRIKESSRPK